jgi:hypothetical protein
MVWTSWTWWRLPVDPVVQDSAVEEAQVGEPLALRSLLGHIARLHLKTIKGKNDIGSSALEILKIL